MTIEIGRFPWILKPAAILALALALLTMASCTTEPSLPTSDWPLSCDFYPPTEGEIPYCARLGDDDEFTIRPDIFPPNSPPESIHAILVGRDILFALPSGRTARALLFDNGPDYFSEGLARTVLDAKVGFVNERLEVVIPRIWDFAFPFEGGLARVCLGCSRVLSPHSEHTEIRGGAWGYIDHTGQIAVPVVHARERLPEPPRLER